MRNNWNDDDWNICDHQRIYHSGDSWIAIKSHWFVFFLKPPQRCVMTADWQLWNSLCQRRHLHFTRWNQRTGIRRATARDYWHFNLLRIHDCNPVVRCRSLFPWATVAAAWRLRKANGSTRHSCYTSSNLITPRKITTERIQGHRGISSISRPPLSHFIRNDTFRSFNYEGKKIRTFSLTSCLSYKESSFRQVAQTWQRIIPEASHAIFFGLKSEFCFRLNHPMNSENASRKTWPWFTNTHTEVI